MLPLQCNHNNDPERYMLPANLVLQLLVSSETLGGRQTSIAGWAPVSCNAYCSATIVDDVDATIVAMPWRPQ